ncbi:MAG: S8 family serine peptidase [Gemmatimonadota bacterium]
MHRTTVRRIRSLVCASLALAMAACGRDTPTAPASSTSTSRLAATMTPIPGRYIVVMKPGQASAISRATSVYNDQVERSYPGAGIAVMRNLSAEQATALSSAAGVEQVVQDQSLAWIPSVQSMFSGVQQTTATGVTTQGTDQSGAAFFGPYQWNMKQVQSPAAWAATPGGLGKMVCVLDTGVDPGQLDMVGKVDLSVSASAVAAEPFIEDLNLHGTFVSGLISSRGIGMASVAPDARLCAVKVLGVSGSGSFGDIINGIAFAATNGSDVINMSLGAYVDRNAPGVEGLILALQQAVNFANDHGVLVVVSSGNSAINLDEDAKNLLEIPAQLKNLISVGATAPINQQNFDLLASYSNYGGKTGIALVAPGGDLVAGGVTQDLVISACSRFNVSFNCTAGNNYLFGAGTSFASPMVAGAAAVVKSQLGTATTIKLRNCIVGGTDVVGPVRIFGAGRLNVAKAAACP